MLWFENARRLDSAISPKAVLRNLPKAPNSCGEEKEYIEPIKSLETWVPTPPRHSGWRSYCTAGLHFLNPSLVLNHLVQYEGIVNCPARLLKKA